jgi:hypothetical protein
MIHFGRGYSYVLDKGLGGVSKIVELLFSLENPLLVRSCDDDLIRWPTFRAGWRE